MKRDGSDAMKSRFFNQLFVLLCIAPFGIVRAEGPARLTPELRQRCMDTLRTGINSDEFWPAIHASEALTLAGAGDEVLTVLRDRLTTEKDDQRRCGLAREM